MAPCRRKSFSNPSELMCKAELLEKTDSWYLPFLLSVTLCSHSERQRRGPKMMWKLGAPMVLHYLPAMWRKANVPEGNTGLWYKTCSYRGGESGGCETLCQYLTMHGQALTSTWKGEIPVFVSQDKNPSFTPCFHSPLASFMTKSVSLCCVSCFLCLTLHFFLPSIPLRNRVESTHPCQKLQYSLGVGAVSYLPAGSMHSHL